MRKALSKTKVTQAVFFLRKKELCMILKETKELVEEKGEADEMFTRGSS